MFGQLGRVVGLARGGGRGGHFFLARRRGRVRALRPLGLPFLDVVRLVRSGGKFNEPVERFGDTGAGLWRDRFSRCFIPS